MPEITNLDFRLAIFAGSMYLFLSPINVLPNLLDRIIPQAVSVRYDLVALAAKIPIFTLSDMDYPLAPPVRLLS